MVSFECNAAPFFGVSNLASRSAFTADEKLAYQEAAVCLTTVAPKLGIGNSTTLWQEMQYVHMSQVTWIHNVVR